jgi:hypothetical protein
MSTRQAVYRRVAAARRRSKRSIRPPRGETRSTPVYAGWQAEQTSTSIEACVARVSKVVPHVVHVTVATMVSGWIPAFTLVPFLLVR